MKLGHLLSWGHDSAVIEGRGLDTADRGGLHALRKVLDCIPGLVVVLSPDCELHAVNQRFLEMTASGCSLATEWRSLVHPEDLDSVLCSFRRAVRDETVYEANHRLLCVGGEYRSFEARGLPHREGGRTLYWCVLLKDVTCLKAAQAKLRAREEELQSLVDHVPGMIATAAPDGTYLYANKRLLDYVGMDLTQLLAVGWLATIHPEEREHTRVAWETAVRQGTPMDVEHRLRNANGKYRWVSAVVEPIRDGEGKICHWYGLLTDIEDVHRAHKEALNRESELRQTVDLIPGYTWCADEMGVICYLNKRILDYLGCPDIEAFRAEALSSYVDEHDVESVLTTWRDATRSGLPFDLQCRIRGKDGISRWFHSVAEAAKDERGSITRWYGLLINIDDRKTFEDALRKTESQLKDATQQAMVGELAAAIAHEVNQPLAAFVTNGAACLSWLSAEPPGLEKAREAAGWMVSDGTDAARVIQRIRALFNSTPLERSNVRINDLISEVIKLMTPRLERERISVETRLCNELPEINGDPVQLKQVVFNLLQNACDAAEETQKDRRIVRISSRADTRHNVVVEITDWGVGVEVSERMFEPFYTTKENGMGMGLAICRSIVETHRGRLWVKPKSGVGATFAFSLPIEERE